MPTLPNGDSDKPAQQLPEEFDPFGESDAIGADQTADTTKPAADSLDDWAAESTPVADSADDTQLPEITGDQSDPLDDEPQLQQTPVLTVETPSAKDDD